MSPDFSVDGVVFAGTNQGGIYKSVDAGTTWEAHNTGLTDPTVNALAISPDFGNDQVVFAAMEDGVFKSGNGGATWEAHNAGLTDLSINTLAISPNFNNDQTLFAGTDSRVFKSIDGGITWFASSDQVG